MGKKIVSEVKGFEGDVILKDPMTFALALEYEEAIADCGFQPCRKAKELIAEAYAIGGDKMDEAKYQEYLAHTLECASIKEKGHCKKHLSPLAMMNRMCPVIMDMVEKWDVKVVSDLGFIPSSPKDKAQEFVALLLKEINGIYEGNELGEADPNA